MTNFFLLLFACMIWGAGFAATRLTLLDYSPLWSNSLRFLFAGAIAAPYLLLKSKIHNKLTPLLCAIFLLAGLQLQTYGIKYTTLAKSGFLTTFYAIFTPVIAYFLYRTKMKISYIALVCVAIFGIALLCDLDFSKFNKGDGLTLLSAFFFSLHILAVDKFGKHENSFDFNLVQCLYIGIIGVSIGVFVEGFPDLTMIFHSTRPFFESSLFGFIVLAIFSSIIAFSIQVYAQKSLPPHIVSFTFLSEAVFSAFFGHLFFNEKLGGTELLGAGIILLSVSLIPLVLRNKVKAI